MSSAEVLTGTKPRPSPPPGLASPTEEARPSLKGTDSRPLEKVFEMLSDKLNDLNGSLESKTDFYSPQILENEDQSGQSGDEGSEVAEMSPSEACDGTNSSISRVGLNGRRGSLQSPEITKVPSKGRRHSTGQALTYR